VRKLHHVVAPEEAGKRLDVALALVFSEFTRSAIQRLIEEGNVTIEGRKERSNYKVKLNQAMVVTLPAAVPSVAQPEDIPLCIVYEDGDLIVIDKSQGMVVHPAAGNYTGTLVNALLYHVDDLSGIGGEQRPGIVHRLDKDTTGLLVVAKNDKSHVALQQQLSTRTMKREYVALVHGALKTDTGTVDAPIARHPQRRKEMAIVKDGRLAITHYTVEERLIGYTVVCLQLETGRTHQIRVHMASIGHPVVGDAVYGPQKSPFALPGQMLHARKLGFLHPSSGERMTFESKVPQVFLELLDKLRKKR